jgi:hypothetical protein
MDSFPDAPAVAKQTQYTAMRDWVDGISSAGVLQPLLPPHNLQSAFPRKGGIQAFGGPPWHAVTE